MQSNDVEVEIGFTKVQMFALRSILLDYIRSGETTEWEDIITNTKTTIEEMLDLVMNASW